MQNALEKGDKLAINQLVKAYKLPNGAVNFGMVLSIPSSERLPQMVSDQGYERVHTLLVAGVQLAMESLNLSNSLNAGQIFDLADTIIDASSEDYLSLPDVVLFLQKLVRGEMGKLYSQIDIAKFMELFEVYREERHQELMRIREEQQAQYKAYGSPERWSDMHKDEERNSYREAMVNYLKNKPADNGTHG